MGTRNLPGWCLLLVLALAPSAQAAPFWGAKAPSPFDTPWGQLKNGEFTWAPEVAPAGPVVVLVSLDEQRAYAYRNGELIGRATVSTGKPGHRTPTGVFTTTLKDKDHHSSIYNNAPMPYTQRFTQGGVALHAGGIPGYPESHGCVHLPSEFARLLFGVSPLGMTVVVADAESAPRDVDHPSFLAPIDAKGQPTATPRLDAGQSLRWEPEKSPEGPLSILVSGADQRIVVMRNGIEIGRARVEIEDPGQPLGTHVYVARQPEAGVGATGGAWTAIGITGHLDDADTAPDPQAMARIAIPSEFNRHLQPLLQPGTTLMVTDAPILEQTTGPRIAVLSSSPEP
jgi:L,D-transpeptidase catalytic domain